MPGGIFMKLVGSAVLSNIGSFFGKNKKTSIIVWVLLLVLVIGGWFLKHKIGNLEDELLSKNLYIQSLELTVSEYEAATEAQNQAISKLKAGDRDWETPTNNKNQQ